MVDGGGLENVSDRLYQDGYICRPTSSQHGQDLARFCAIFPIVQSTLITDPLNFARKSLI